MNSCENDEISNDSKKELKLDNFRNALSLSKIKLRETIGKLQSKKVKTSRSFAANDFGSFQEIEVIKSMNELECNKLLNPTLIASKELLYSYGLTENDLIEEKIDPNGSEMINYGIYLSVAEKELEESKTVAFDFKSLLGSEMYASKVGQCAGDALGISYDHHIYKDGYYQHGFPLGHAMGGDGQMLSLGGDIRFDVMNRLNGRAMVAKVNQSNSINNQAFTQKDEIKALDLTWTHYLKPNAPLKMNGWVSDSDVYGQDAGVSIGVEIPLDRSLF